MDESEFEELMKIQRLMASSIVSESETDTKIQVMEVLSDMVPNKQGLIAREQVFVESRSRGMLDTEVMRMLDQLRSDGIIEEPRSGFLRMT